MSGAGNSKEAWKTINGLMGKNKQKLPPSFNFNGDSITDNFHIAKMFNNYFSSIGSQLANNIDDTQTTFNAYLPEPRTFSFYLRLTTVSKIKSVTRNIKVFPWPR